MITVYKITNKVNDRCYFGITKQTAAFRWRQHVLLALRGDRKGALQGAILKYGEETFEVSDIYQAVSIREAQAVERGLIAQHGTMWPNGYNMSSGGEFRTGYQHSPATKSKMSAAAVGREISDKQRSVASQNMKRLWEDPDYRARAVASQQSEAAKVAREKHNRKMSEARKGQPGFFAGRNHSEETKAVLSAKGKGRAAWNKGVPMSDEQKALLVSIHIGSKHSEEHRLKISAGLNKSETKAKKSLETKSRWATPEGREKMLRNRTYPKRPPLTAEQRAARSDQMRRIMADPGRLALARESGKRQFDIKRYGAATAGIRALARKLPTDLYPREVA